MITVELHPSQFSSQLHEKMTSTSSYASSLVTKHNPLCSFRRRRLFKLLTIVEAMTGKIKSSCWLGLDMLSSSDNGEVSLRSSDNCLSSLSACEVRFSFFFLSKDEWLAIALLFSFVLDRFVSVSSSVSKHSE